MFSLTDLGISVTTEVEKVNTRNGAFSFWSNYLGIGQSKILKTILDNPGIDLDELGNQSGYTNGGGTFGNYIRELKRLELITITDKIAKPNNVFFQLVNA